MYIHKLLLVNYNRLMLSNIQRLEWTPKSHLMLILGRNGSGKSSLLEELTPVPAGKDQFAKGGIKEILITHDGSEYKLHSAYAEKGSGSHSFIKDNEELNPGGTLAVQKELVWHFFKLDRATHDVLIGIQRFTTMSTAQRREWLRKLTPVDMDYAFNRFDHVRRLHRDQQGVIKHLAKKMTQENVDLHDDAQVAALRQEMDRLTNQLNELFQVRVAGTTPKFYSNSEAQGKLLSMISQGKDLLKFYPEFAEGVHVKSNADFQFQLEQLHNAITRHESVISHIADELHALDQVEANPKEAMSQAEMDSLKGIIEELNQKKQTLDNQVIGYKGFFPLVEFDIQDNAKQKLKTLFDRWVTLIKTTPNNEETNYNTKDARDIQEQIKNAESYLGRAEAQSLVNRNRLAVIKGCENIVCPSCTHEFKPGVGTDEVEAITTKQKAIHENIDKAQAFIDEKTKYIEGFRQFSGYVHSFSTLAQEYREFDKLWLYCAEHRVMVVNPRRYTNDALDWFDAMNLVIDQAQVQEQLVHHTNRLNKAVMYNEDAVSFVDNKRKELHSSIDQKAHEVAGLKYQARDMKRAGQQVTQFEADVQKLMGEFALFYRDVNAHLEHLVQKGVEEQIKSVQIETAQARHKLQEFELLEQRLAIMQTEHKEAIELQSDLGLLVKALSSTEGLIGRYLKGFMQAMVGLMNTVIEEIWTYPLEILPSKVEKEELDYTFPLKVDNGSLIAPDISRGSASQRDVVDFAFKLLAMKFLGFEDYPLFLDEFGNTFDEQHRFNLVPFLVQLIELNQVQQIFYVSHYTAIHGAFNQSEFLVIDQTNITLPVKYNENAILS